MNDLINTLGDIIVNSALLSSDKPQPKSSSDNHIAVLGGGCFWCTEAVFDRVQGVKDVVSGYAGGTTPNPTYQQVCTGTTGHAEVVSIEFDPAVISYSQILGIFMATHDPTTLNRQGHDIGTQYRSIILTTSDDQDQQAKQAIKELARAGVYDNPIVTEVKKLEAFYPAEPEHQQYFAKHPEAGYCQAVINPKLAKFRDKFKRLLKD